MTPETYVVAIRWADLKLAFGALVTVITCLTGTIAYLFTVVIKLNKQISDTRERVGRLEGREEGIKNLAEDVLSAVREAIRDKKDK